MKPKGPGSEMALPEESEAELRALVERLDRLVPREGAHLTVPSDPEGHASAGSRRGYLRLGTELLRAALDPLPGGEDQPARIEPELGYLLTPDSRAPFDLCEVDESIVSRPPVRTRLGAPAQLLTGVVVVGLLVLLFVAAALVLGRLLG